MSSNQFYKDKIEKYSKKLAYVGGTSTSLDMLLLALFSHQLQIKMLHFQTKKYSTHKILDAYLLTFCANLDKFIEVAQGSNNKRLSLDKIRIDVDVIVDMPDNSVIIDSLDTFIRIVLNGYIDMLEYSHKNSLLAIKDEMVVSAQETKYLLSFN
jgi:hypothetical protein